MILDISKINIHNLFEYEKGLIRRCVICGTEFRATRKTQIACSPKCNCRVGYKRRKELK